jgi:hypothetical protein
MKVFGELTLLMLLPWLLMTILGAIWGGIFFLWYRMATLWRLVPPEIAGSEGFKPFGLRPSLLWAGVFWAHIISPEKWLGAPFAEIVSFLGGSLLILLILGHFIWALRILRRRKTVDTTLLRFARYTVALSAFGLLLLIVQFKSVVAG